MPTLDFDVRSVSGGQGGAPSAGGGRNNIIPDPPFRALSGRLKFTVRRHKFNKDSLSSRTISEYVCKYTHLTGVPHSHGNAPSLDPISRVLGGASGGGLPSYERSGPVISDCSIICGYTYSLEASFDAHC
jgi:hypothetical protein